VESGRLHPRHGQVPGALEGCDVPYDLVYLLVLQLVKDAIRANQKVVERLRAIRLKDYVRLARYAVLDPAE
jgi:hypothetical protein